jgi:HAD superfamily hydrolase (TIGR01509 family)
VTARRSGRFDAVLFDLYETLVRAELPPLPDRLSTLLGVSAEALLRAFDATQAERDTGAFESAEGDTAAVVRACGLELAPHVVRDLTARRQAFLLGGGIRLFDDVLPVLRRLRSDGLKTAIVSNCGYGTRPVVQALGLEREVDAVVLSCELGAKKPDAAIYRAALDRLGAPPERAAFIDDLVDYCAGAEALGIRAYRIVRDAAGAPAPDGWPRTVASLDALLTEP